MTDRRKMFISHHNSDAVALGLLKELPSNWRCVSLREISNSSGEYGAGLSGIPYSDDLYRYIRISDVNNDGTLNADSLKSLSLKEGQEFCLDKGDMLFARSGSVGRTYLHDGSFPAAFAGYMIRFKINNKKANAKYVFAWTQSSEYRKWLNKTMRVAAQPNINAREYGEMPIALPPIAEQERIAEILSDADAAIAKTEMLVKKASKQVLSLQQKLINSPLYAGKWNFVSFSDSLLQKREKTKRPNAYPALTSSRRGIFLQDEYFTRQVASQDNTGYLIVRKGDFTYRAMAEGDSRFVFNQLLDHDAGIVSPAYFVFGIKNSDPVFFRHLLNCSAFGYAIKKVVQGGTRKALKFNTLKGLRIWLPNQEAQIKIGRILFVAEQERDILQQQVTALKKQKRGLMQKLLTGTWRVNHV